MQYIQAAVENVRKPIIVKTTESMFLVQSYMFVLLHQTNTAEERVYPLIRIVMIQVFPISFSNVTSKVNLIWLEVKFQVVGWCVGMERGVTLMDGKVTIALYLGKLFLIDTQSEGASRCVACWDSSAILWQVPYVTWVWYHGHFFILATM